MILASKELKRRARAALEGNYFPATSLSTSLALFTFVLALLPPYSGFADAEEPLSRVLYWVIWMIVLLLRALMAVGLTQFVYSLNFEEKQPKKPFQLFHGFRNQPDTFLLTFAFRYLIILIWFVPAIFRFLQIPAGLEPSRIPGAVFPALLLFLVGLIPAVAAWLPFCMTTYILLEDPNRSAQDALLTSMRIMKGQKKHMLTLILSFLPLCLLIPTSVGMAYLWIQPYCQGTLAQFYLQVRDVPQ